MNRAFLTLALAVPNALEKPAPFGELWDEIVDGVGDLFRSGERGCVCAPSQKEKVSRCMGVWKHAAGSNALER